MSDSDDLGGAGAVPTEAPGPFAGTPLARDQKTGLGHRLYHGETTFDFVRKKWIGYTISGVLIALSIIALFARGLNLGIDFEGGVSWKLPQNGVSQSQASDILSANGVQPRDAKIQVLSIDSGVDNSATTVAQTTVPAVSVTGTPATIGGTAVGSASTTPGTTPTATATPAAATAAAGSSSATTTASHGFSATTTTAASPTTVPGSAATGSTSPGSAAAGATLPATVPGSVTTSVTTTASRLPEANNGKTLQVQAPVLPDATREKIRADLAKAAGVSTSAVTEDVVSATWGGEVTNKAIISLLVFFLVLSVYIWLRFEWKMATAAITAVIHDVFISVGIYAIFGFPVTPATVIAFLTILGFSLYDTIVVFDKVLDNTKKFGNRVSYADIVNLSMNQVLMRSLNTSIAAILPVFSILVIGSFVMGAVALEDFALALLVGLITGSYSSIFIATPVLAWQKEREPRYKALKGRQATPEEITRMRMGEGPSTSRARRIPTVMTTSAMGAQVASVDPTAALTHPPRPRKKRRR